MTTSTDPPAGGERFEGVVQVAIMLVIGGMAGAASFTHVHDVAVAHGQPDWIGWADAVVVELMSIALGLELRRRARTSRPTGFVLNALVFFIAVSLAAQVVQAEPSVIGWLAAALPALGFLVLAKVVLSRTAARQTAPPQATPSTQPPADVEAVSAPATVDRASATSATTPTTVALVAPAHLLTPARFAATNHQQTTGRPITAGELATRMSITPEVAGRLLIALQNDGTPAARGDTRPVNGAQVAFREATP